MRITMMLMPPSAGASTQRNRALSWIGCLIAAERPRTAAELLKGIEGLSAVGVGVARELRAARDALRTLIGEARS